MTKEASWTSPSSVFGPILLCSFNSLRFGGRIRRVPEFKAYLINCSCKLANTQSFSSIYWLCLTFDRHICSSSRRGNFLHDLLLCITLVEFFALVSLNLISAFLVVYTVLFQLRAVCCQVIMNLGAMNKVISFDEARFHTLKPADYTCRIP